MVLATRWSVQNLCSSGTMRAEMLGILREQASVRWFTVVLAAGNVPDHLARSLSCVSGGVDTPFVLAWGHVASQATVACPNAAEGPHCRSVRHDWST